MLVATDLYGRTGLFSELIDAETPGAVALHRFETTDGVTANGLSGHGRVGQARTYCGKEKP